MCNELMIELLREAKRLAQEYRQLTGKPLGITGEVVEYGAARILGLTLTPALQDGYDAIEHKAMWNDRYRSRDDACRAVRSRGVLE